MEEINNAMNKVDQMRKINTLVSPSNDMQNQPHNAGPDSQLVTTTNHSPDHINKTTDEE